MRTLIYILFIFATPSLWAQQMPERSEVRKGNRQYNKGEYQKSIERYQRALDASPGSFESIYNMGNALYKAERFDQAEKTMQQSAADSLRVDSERAEAFYNLGNAQFKQEKYKEALESYKQSLRMNPADTQAKYNYAYTKRMLDQQKDGGGGDDKKDQDQEKDQQDQNKDQQDQNKDQQDQNKDQQDKDKGDQDKGDKDEKPGDQKPTPSGISPQEQEQMLDAIQAQEDKTQEKLKEKAGVVVRNKKNW